jgi:hypothetical protein
LEKKWLPLNNLVDFVSMFGIGGADWEDTDLERSSTTIGLLDPECLFIVVPVCLFPIAVLLVPKGWKNDGDTRMAERPSVSRSHKSSQIKSNLALSQQYVIFVSPSWRTDGVSMELKRRSHPMQVNVLHFVQLVCELVGPIEW